MNSTKYIIVSVIAVIIQLLICEFVNIWPPVYITILPLLIIMLPFSVNDFVLLISAFLIGLLLDAFSDGILGLNAAALTAVAFAKHIFIRRLTKYSSQNLVESIENFSQQPIKILWMILLSYLVFYLIYFLLDGLSNGNVLFILIRLGINLILGVTIAYALERLWIRKIFSY